MKSQELISNCPICGGSGWIYHTDENGYEIAEHCDCWKRNFVELVNTKCGLSEEELSRMTMDKFKTDTAEAAEMKKIADTFLADRSASGLGFFGKSGTGKTHLCVAVCQELTKRDMAAWKYFSYRSEIQNLQALYYEPRLYREEVMNYSMTPILYIDDLLKFAKDKNGKYITSELRILYDIINARYLNGKITIFSSETTLSDIYKTDAAIGSRIYEMVKPYGLRLSGQNRRMTHDRNTVF